MNQKDAPKAVALTRYLWWVTHNGQAYAASLGYMPLPEAVIQKDEANILKIQVEGKPALSTTIVTSSTPVAATTEDSPANVAPPTPTGLP